jgi:uncharacterized protein (TIGR03083 family)
MAQPSPWPIIHAERAALAADLANLTDLQWSTLSLCREWSVKDMLAHMTATAKMTPPRFFAHFGAAGFNFAKMSAKDVAAEAAQSSADLLAEFSRVTPRRTAPPGPVEAMLGEVVIHPEDIRRPLGITHQYPADAVVRVADFYKASNLIVGAKNRIAGLRLRATDADWTHGAGPEVAGPVLSLVLAMTGRAVAVGQLSGDGVATLQSRMP